MIQRTRHCPACGHPASPTHSIDRPAFVCGSCERVWQRPLERGLSYRLARVAQHEEPIELRSRQLHDFLLLNTSWQSSQSTAPSP
jgi:hypothetical protein